MSRADFGAVTPAMRECWRLARERDEREWEQFKAWFYGTSYTPPAPAPEQLELPFPPQQAPL